MLPLKDAHCHGSCASEQHMALYPRLVLQNIFVNKFQFAVAIMVDGWDKL
jgi:heterodisulfide reductase subunit C